MNAIKRIDVILPEALVQPFTDLIESESFQAYSVNTGLSGRSRGGLATAGLCDAAVTILCSIEETPALAAAIEAFLTRYGGVGCITEGQGINCG
jgi:hypothetical protein